MATLYGYFGESFPGYSSFWFNLQNDEKRHANLVANLMKLNDTKEFEYHVDIEQVMDFYSFYKNLRFLTAAAYPELALFSCEEAVWFTQYIEQETINQLRIKLTTTTHSRMYTILNILMEETKGHFQLVRDFSEEYELDPIFLVWDIQNLVDKITVRIRTRGVDMAMIQKRMDVLNSGQESAIADFDTNISTC